MKTDLADPSCLRGAGTPRDTTKLCLLGALAGRGWVLVPMPRLRPFVARPLELHPQLLQQPGLHEGRRGPPSTTTRRPCSACCSSTMGFVDVVLSWRFVVWRQVGVKRGASRLLLLCYLFGYVGSSRCGWRARLVSPDCGFGVRGSPAFLFLFLSSATVT